jgi:hypothetical protein
VNPLADTKKCAETVIAVSNEVALEINHSSNTEKSKYMLLPEY